MNIRATLVVALATFFVAPLTAQELDPEQIQKDLDHVFERPPGRVDRAVVKERFAEFWKRYEGKELGHLSYARGLSHYWNGEMDKAIAAFDAYLEKYDPKQVRSDEQRMTIGRAFLSTAVRAGREQDLSDKKNADRYVNYAVKFARCYDDVRSVGQYMTRGLEKHAELAARVRVAMCREVLKKDLAPSEADATIQALYATAAGGAGGRAGPARPGRAAPARPKQPTEIQPFVETAMSGRVIDLKAYRGQVVLVDFWATWCGPCIRELPNVVKAYDKYHREGFEIVGVSLDKPDAEKKIREMSEKLGMKWEHIYDGGYWDAKLAKANGIRSIPAAFLIDRAGKVRFSGMDARGEKLLENLGTLIAEKSALRR